MERTAKHVTSSGMFCDMSSTLLLLYTRRDLLTKKLEELCIVNDKR